MNAHTGPRAPAPFDVRDPESVATYARTLDCIHCGLCLRTCPTYELTGVESSSPRGRIHLVRSRIEGRIEPGPGYADELSFCLLCRRCESVCPAGVHFGPMMEHARDEQRARAPGSRAQQLLRHIAFRMLLPSRTALRVAGALARFGEITGLRRLAARFLGARGEWIERAPRVPSLAEQRPLPSRTQPAPGAARRGDVTLLEGCVAQVLVGAPNRATVRSLAALGLGVDVPREVVCCGSLHAHNGDLDGARELARRAIRVFERSDSTIVTNSAGCGSHLRELANLFAADDEWRERAARVAARVRDYSEVVAGPLAEVAPRAPTADPVVYDDPCHLCHGQGVRAAPRAVLDALQGLDRRAIDDPEACCGAAGLYSLTRPEDSAAVFAIRREAFVRSGAKVLVTANPGCLLQWSSGLAGSGARVVHLAELVDEALAVPRSADVTAARS